MKHRLLFTVLLALLSVAAMAKGDDPLQYDIEAAGSGTQGTYLVRVWVYSKSGKVSDADIKKAAVHGVTFRGFAAGEGSPAQRPIAPSPTVETQHADYFGAFFKGPHEQFANIVTGSYRRTKLSKGYKSGAVVQVQKDALRHELEEAGIVRGLSSGF